MLVTPSSNIRLIKCPLRLDNKNQITFANSNEQYNYFSSLPYTEIEDGTYQRKNGTIRYPGLFDDLIGYNYCMYQNENFSNKWFYAYITSMQYVNNGMTLIGIATDVFQTWQFDLQYKDSFIEREMINTSEDVPGANLIPEGLEFGELKVGGTAEFDNLEPVWVIAYLGETFKHEGQDIPIGNGGYIANGMAQTVTFIICTSLDAYNSVIGGLQVSENESNYIMSCFSIPRLAVQDFLNSSTAILGINGAYALIQGNTYNQSPVTKTLVSTPSSLDGYTPRNQKLRTYPYCYLGFNPANGTAKVYRYEDFINGSPQFKLISEVNPNPSVYFIPQNYRGSSGDSMSDIASLNGYPTLSSRSDYYNTWLAQNSQIISLQMQQEQASYNVNRVGSIMNGATGVASSVAGAVGGSEENVAGLTGSIANQGLSTAQNVTNMDINHEYYVKQQLAQMDKQQLLPDNASLSSSNATLLGYGIMDKNIFTRYTIKSQFAERLDKYFDMYGYTTNQVKVPNINNRPNWNYVKTIGCNIIADIPQDDLFEICDMFNNGITLWHNTNTYLDYSQNNR